MGAGLKGGWVDGWAVGGLNERTHLLSLSSACRWQPQSSNKRQGEVCDWHPQEAAAAGHLKWCGTNAGQLPGSCQRG